MQALRKPSAAFGAKMQVRCTDQGAHARPPRFLGPKGKSHTALVLREPQPTRSSRLKSVLAPRPAVRVVLSQKPDCGSSA